MVYYYCEFCNKNINIKAEAIPICPECQHPLHSPSITTQERKRREREHTTYCENCDLIVYSVPVQHAIKTLNEENHHKINLIKNPPKVPHYVKDARFKSGYRTTKKGEEAEFVACCYCILFLIFIGLAVVTYGIALLALIPLYLSYQKKEEEKNQVIQGIYDSGQKAISVLDKTKEEFKYVCNRCFSGVKLGKLPEKIKSKPILSKITPSNKRYCKFCGAETNLKVKFCENCGSELI